MRFSVEGLSDGLTAGVREGLTAAGHEPSEPVELAVVGVDLPGGPDVVDLTGIEWERTIGAIRAAFFAIRRAAASMTERGVAGRILVLVPAHAVRPSRGCGADAIAGSFLTTVGQVAAVELAPKGIRVNVVVFGPLEGTAPERVAEAVPTGRLVQAREVGDVCALLAAPEADAVNGAVVAVDGGYVVTKAGGGSPFARPD
jgi:NAD(P)-dependent dehydrogenase (short-subunit alcohol dehydrogenase family)